MKKSSHSKKVMKMMDKERRKKKSSGRTTMDGNGGAIGGTTGGAEESGGGSGGWPSAKPIKSTDSSRIPSPPLPPSFNSSSSDHLNSKKRINPDSSNNCIQTEIRTDDFVVRLLLSIFLPFYPSCIHHTYTTHTHTHTHTHTLHHINYICYDDDQLISVKAK